MMSLRDRFDEANLTQDQKRAFNSVKSGRNVFITGAGGVGKSYLYEYIENWCLENGKKLITCAPTGIAAVKIGGCTIHKAMRISPTDTIEHHDKPFMRADAPMGSCDVLIVDEISMCRIDLFDYMTNCLMQVNSERFRKGEGQVQLILMGDFCQLPPVMFGKDQEILETLYGEYLNDGYCYGTAAWNYWNFETVELTTIMRQGDVEFIEALNKCRVGDASGLEWIYMHSADEPVSGAIKMYGRNVDVDAENQNCLDEIDADEKTYRAIKSGDVPENNMIVPEELRLKIGARVMLVVNIEDKYNGSMGYVLDMDDKSVQVSFDDGRVMDVKRYTWDIKAPKVHGRNVSMETVGTYIQIPLKLAYAVTIHKSQGQTFDAVALDPSCWERGQLYTALSRLSSVEGLYFVQPPSEFYLIAPKFASEVAAASLPASNPVDDFYYQLGNLAVAGHERAVAGQPDSDVLEQMLIVIWNRLKGGIQ